MGSSGDNRCLKCSAPMDKFETRCAVCWKPPNLVGFSGKIDTGKTTIAAQHLVDTYGFRRMSFSNPLKMEIISLGFDPDVVCLEKPPHIRRLLQTLGHAHRLEDPMYFVDKMMPDATGLLNIGTCVVFDDVRFPNEVKAIEAVGGVVVRLERSDQLRLFIGVDESETALDEWMFGRIIVAEQGELDKIRDGVDKLMGTKEG